MINSKYSLAVPFISSVNIVLNTYNGDILGISPNIEYLLWYLIPLFLFLRHIYLKPEKEVVLEYLMEILVCFLVIIFNIYWHYAWIADIKTNYRHRTEYYDTQTLISSFVFVILYLQYQKDIQRRLSHQI